MDWFERITGFREGGYAATQAQLLAEGEQLVSRAIGSRYGMGRLELVSLRSLRERCARLPPGTRRSSVQSIVGDARALHLEPTARDVDELRGQLCIGLHHDVEVTDAPQRPGPKVTQAFCSALPVAYTDIAPSAWEPFARLVLGAVYEATLRAAALRHQEGGSPKVPLTRLGGGAFGNDDRWIDDAMARALALVETSGLDVRLVSYGRAHPSHTDLQHQWSR